jgi:urease accessory protein UreE
MTIVEQITSHHLRELPQYDGYRKETITLAWEDRRQGHGRRRSDAGTEFAISLPSGTVLKAGDCLVLEAERVVVAVREAPEPVYVISPKTPQEWAYFAYQIGNRHQSLMIGQTELIFPQTAAVRSLLDQLRVQYTVDTRPFTAALAHSGHSH